MFHLSAKNAKTTKPPLFCKDWLVGLFLILEMCGIDYNASASLRINF